MRKQGGGKDPRPWTLQHIIRLIIEHDDQPSAFWPRISIKVCMMVHCCKQLYLLILVSSWMGPNHHTDAFRSSTIIPLSTRNLHRRSTVLMPSPKVSVRWQNNLPPQQRIGMIDAQEEEAPCNSHPKRTTRYTVLGLASAVAWTATTIVVLSYHPDPKFSGLSLKHNLFTMGQALAFPLPVLAGVTHALSQPQPQPKQQRIINKSRNTLNLGLTISMLWLAASTIRPAPFCFGYELIRPRILQQTSTAVYLLLAAVALCDWWKTTTPSSSSSSLSSSSSSSSSSPTGALMKRRCSSVIHGAIDNIFGLLNPPKDSKGHTRTYALASLGLFWFTLLPIVSPYPLATIPSILGKRLSRPASAWTWLGAVACMSLSSKEDAADHQNPHPSLKRGLFVGSVLHLALVVLKLIGLDDGGLFLPGTGLWDWYPAMMAVPFATLTSCLVHGLVVFAGYRQEGRGRREPEQYNDFNTLS
jgi:hypothetical protein